MIPTRYRPAPLPGTLAAARLHYGFAAEGQWRLLVIDQSAWQAMPDDERERVAPRELYPSQTGAALPEWTGMPHAERVHHVRQILRHAAGLRHRGPNASAEALDEARLHLLQTLPELRHHLA
jgi:hypothetical protein